MNNVIGNKIRKMRENLSISQDAMASELEVTQSNYGRLEKDDNRLNVPKLKKIAEVIVISVSFLFDEKNARIINQQHNETASAYNVETHVQADKEHINSLKEEIDFLRTFLKNA
ncbi:helix-turn-helix domain-containing protein [Aequorivita xiaoshiensis]|uniref:Helix-turn-helix domain-containing protein n=1 Tax=Aequorivita xiaoshiensis TaxID=2874476 RepID=A0A9X1UBL2_9FLAO|nr:helix-turn-helix transcriptional regulator [Aequorivita xiaoshiensis]MCG2429691.1 helix-turn-helix domain-containing protein [Aequorivita xiaoshiensis]